MTNASSAARRSTWEDNPRARSWTDPNRARTTPTQKNSIWVCDDQKIKVTQFVELVRGEQSRLLDTCRVRYRIENLPNGAERQVGIRFLLDTFIGGNDGVPFTIPGDSDLCDTKKDLPLEARDKNIPAFLQRWQKSGDLAHPRDHRPSAAQTRWPGTPHAVTLERVAQRETASPRSPSRRPLHALERAARPLEVA